MASSKKYPKHVRITGTTLNYQRSIPKRLAHLTGKRLWSYPLKLQLNATDTSINRAVVDAETAFELFKKTLETTDPAAYAETEIDRLAQDILRRRSLSAGQFESVNSAELNLSSSDIADFELPEVEDLVFKLTSQPDYNKTIRDEAFLKAHSALVESQKRGPKTLSQLWVAYLNYREVDTNTREGRRVQRTWERLIEVMKDSLISPDSPNFIERGIDRYVDQQRELGIQNATIRRYLTEPMACFSWANRRYRLQWRPIQLPPLKPSKEKPRQPLSHEQQRDLVAHCLHKRDWVAVSLLVMLQGGCMPTELARLRVDQDISLESDTPHIVISGGDEGLTKQASRKRFIPIVLGLGLVEEQLSSAVTRLSQLKEPSASISKRMKMLFGSNYTGHSLRHSFRANGLSAGVDSQALEAIGGWSGGGVNRVMLNYGSTGIGNSEILHRLATASKKIHSHLMAISND